MQRNRKYKKVLGDENRDENDTNDESNPGKQPSENNPVTDVAKRGNRAQWASYIVLFVTSVLVFTFTWYSRHEVIYVPVNITNETASKYFKKQVTTNYHGFFVCALTVFSVLIGAVVDRLTLVAEEIFHVKSRYDGKCCKMFKACFSGMAWKVILLGIILASIIIFIYLVILKIDFKLDYLVLVFSGIGFGPLVQRLLKLDTQSEVHISTILEEKGKLVANVLAWSYYLNDLKIVLPKIQHAIDNSRWKYLLSSEKLVILLPLDGKTDPQNLSKVDQRLLKEDSITCEKNPELFFYVLSVRSNGTKKYFLFTFAKALQTIFSMSELEKVFALPRDKREEEVQICCQSLAKIVNDPVDVQLKDKCVVIPYKEMEKRKNNWLVKRILETEENLVGTGSSVAAVGTEHDYVPGVTTNENTTHVENTTNEEIHTQDVGAADFEDRDGQYEGSPHSIDNEAHRAERHQPSNNTPPQTMGIDNLSQASNNIQPLLRDASTQTMSINNSLQPRNIIPPLTTSINNPPKPSNNTQLLPSNTPSQTMSINNPPQPQTSNTPPQTTNADCSPQPSNNISPEISNNTQANINKQAQTINTELYSAVPQPHGGDGLSEHNKTPFNEVQSAEEDTTTIQLRGKDNTTKRHPKSETSSPSKEEITVAQVHRNQPPQQQNTREDGDVSNGAMSNLADSVEGTNGEIHDKNIRFSSTEKGKSVIKRL